MRRCVAWGRWMSGAFLRSAAPVVAALAAAVLLTLTSQAAAQPVVDFVTPDTVTYGVTPSRAVTMQGSGFQVGDTIAVGSLSGTTVAGTSATASTPFVFTNASTLSFYWSNTSLAPGVSYNVVVTNPSSGATATAVGAFTVVSPQPVMNIVTPDPVTYGVTTSRAILVDGSDFVVGATVAITRVATGTTVLSGTTVAGSTATASVPFVHVSMARLSWWWANTGLAPGAYTITVTNPAAAGGLSGSVGFTVAAPQPVIGLVTPDPVTYGVTTSRAILVDGSDFVVGATVAITRVATGTTVLS
ncbi:MAG: hypothetical protein ACOYXR_11955, partial [Nitrospirota bacterium]